LEGAAEVIAEGRFGDLLLFGEDLLSEGRDLLSEGLPLLSEGRLFVVFAEGRLGDCDGELLRCGCFLLAEEIAELSRADLSFLDWFRLERSFTFDLLLELALYGGLLGTLLSRREGELLLILDGGTSFLDEEILDGLPGDLGGGIFSAADLRLGDSETLLLSFTGIGAPGVMPIGVSPALDLELFLLIIDWFMLWFGSFFYSGCLLVFALFPEMTDVLFLSLALGCLDL
jgi:hypothetical protein